MNTRLTALEKETLLETIEEQIETLSRMTVRQLHQRHLELFGEPTRSNHRQFLFRRIAWRIQALAEGGLSERARRRAMEIANDADLRIRAPRMLFGKDFTLDRKASESRRVSGHQDPRLPPPGSFLEREFRGHRIIVKIRPEGFEFEDRPYRSLSAIAREVTGTKWNGFAFFGRAQRKSAGSARSGSDRTGGRGRDLVGVSGDVSTGEVTKSRGGTDQ